MSDWPLRVMIYGAGEAIDGEGALAPQIQAQLGRLSQIVTDRYVAAVVQLDSSNVPTLRYVLDPQGRQPVYQIPNVNVGDPRQLINFVTWSAAVCPAKRSMLVLSGHGLAWEDGVISQALGGADRAVTRSPTAVPEVAGAIHNARSLFGVDVNPTAEAVRAVLIDGHDRDFLSNAELGSVCSQINVKLGAKLDVLVFDACLMSSWEILHELSDSVNAVVASVDELSAAGIDFASTAAKISAGRGLADANTIATALAGNFRPQTAFDSCVAIDLSNPSWASAILEFREFCASFLSWIQQSPDNAATARTALRTGASLVKYSSGGLADVAALAEAITSIAGISANAVTAITNAAAALAACVLAKSVGRDYQSATGLSIFAPSSATAYQSNRSDYIRLQFSTLTGWGAILDVLYGFGNAHARFIRNETNQLAVSASADDAEFVVSLRGFPIGDDLREGIEKAINRAVLDVLASIDMLGNVSVIQPEGFIQTRGLQFPGDRDRERIQGLVVISNDDVLATARGPKLGGPTRSSVVQSSGSEFRVLLRGLKLDQVTKNRIEAAIRSAVLQVIASIDLGPNLQVASPSGDSATRSLLGKIGGHVLGFVVKAV